MRSTGWTARDHAHRAAARRPTASSVSSWGPTTTSPSRSRRASSWRASRPCSGVRGRRRRRSNGSRSGDLVLDAAAREVRKGDAEVRLTAREFDLLWFLASHPRRVFSRDQIMSRVWGYDGGARHRDRDGPRPAPAREDRGRPERAPTSRDRLGRRLPVHAVSELALAAAAGILTVGSARGDRARPAPNGPRPPGRAHLDRRRCSRSPPSCSRASVMFDMHADAVLTRGRDRVVGGGDRRRVARDALDLASARRAARVDDAGRARRLLAPGRAEARAGGALGGRAPRSTR